MSYHRAVISPDAEKRLAHYTSVLEQWSTSLYELDEHATYRLLAAGEMYGVTGERANHLVASAPMLWSWMGLLRQRIELVNSLVEASTVLNNKIAEIDLMLTGKNLPVPRSGITNELLSEVRGYLDLSADYASGGEIETSCDGLIELFRAVYDPVRAVVAEVDAVWRDLMPRIEAATTTLDRATAVSARLETTVPQVLLATQRLEAVRASVSDDPLSLSDKVGPDLDALVASAARAVGDLERSHSELGEDLAHADTLLAELRVIRARAAAAYSEAKAKVVAEDRLIRVPSTAVIDGQNGLAHRSRRFAALEETSVDWRAARHLVDDWMSSAHRLREQLEKALSANALPLAQRSDMRALLRAYRVKASMMPGLPDEIADLGQEAHDELYTAPTDLARARELMDRFAAELNTYGGAS